MNKKTLKTVASAMIIAFGVSVLPAPAYAVSTNIVAETKNKTTLTISQIQDLAVIYNDTNQKLQLQKKQLELNEQMLRNERRSAENKINSMGSSSSGSSGMSSANLNAAIEQYAKEYVAAGNKPEDLATDPYYLNLKLTAATAAATEQSMYASAQAGLDQALAGIEQINDTLDTLADGKDDLNKGMEDLEKQMRYAALNLSLNAVQLEKTIDMMEEQAALAERSIKIAELQQKLGMNITTDVSKAQTNLVEVNNMIAGYEENLSVIKRSINILIGRNAGNPLEIVPMNLPVAISPAPAYTEKLIDKFVDNNYSLKTLERDKANLKDSVEDDMGSDEKQNIDYDVMAKDMEIDNKKQAIEDDLKAMLAKINSDGQAYKVSRQKYVDEKKNFEFMQKKYDLGMISELVLRQAEATLKQAEMTNMANGYQYYLDWQKYYLAEQGVDVSGM